MCGRYFLDDTKEANERLLNLLRGLLESGDPLASQVHTGEIFPTQLAPVIVADGGGVGRARHALGLSARWRPGRGHQQPFGKGRFYPHVPACGAGAPLPGAGFRLLRMAAHSLRRKNEGKFAFQSQGGVDKGLMYLAGVYGEFLGGFRAGGFDGFAILTREADEQMRPYHDRMPVILDDESVKKLWLLSPPQIPYADLRRHFDPPRLYVRPAPAER